MALKFPESMEECTYFTRREIGNGKVAAWVFRELCPKCKKGMMGKPKDPKTGKPKIRADTYECPECGYSEKKTEYEIKQTCNIQYTCPKCNNQGETQIPFKRKKIKGVDTIIFSCEKCGEKIPITKKMKDIKEK